VAIAHLKPIQTKYDEVVKESGYLDHVLHEWREKAAETAFKTLNTA
jgi:tryptophanyl-tRNA synthetase